MLGLNLEKWVEPPLAELSENPETGRPLAPPRTLWNPTVGTQDHRNRPPPLLRKG